MPYREKSPLSRLDTTIKHRIAARFSFDGYLDFLLEHADSYGNLAARYVGWDGRETLERFFARPCSIPGFWNKATSSRAGSRPKMRMPLAFPHENRSKAATTYLERVERAKIERLYPLDFFLYKWQLAALEENRAEQAERWPREQETALTLTLSDGECEFTSPEEWSATSGWENHVSRTGSP